MILMVDYLSLERVALKKLDFVSKNVQLLCCYVLILISGCSDSDNPPAPLEPTIQYAKSFGGSLNELANDIVTTQDGGYAVFGFTQSLDGDITDKSTDNFDYWLLKFDTNDQLIWSKTYGGSQTEKGFKIITTNDGGFAVIGTSESNDIDVSENNGWNDLWIIKLDSNGIIQWEKSHGFTGNDQGLTIIKTADGGYFIGGVLDVSASGGAGNDRSARQQHAGGDYWGIKLNANGDKEWRRYFGGSFTDTTYDVIETSDTGFLLIGSSDSDDVDISGNKGGYDFWVVKTDSNGTLEWEKSFGGSEIDEARSITKTNDGNYLILGDTRSTDQDISSNNGAADMWLIKISESGNLLWEKTYGGSSFDVGRHISQTFDGGYLLTGSSRSVDGDVDTNKGQNDVWILKINNTGDIQWQKTVGGSEIDFAYGIIELNDGAIIAVGETNSNDGDVLENKGFSDLLITKIIVE